MTTSPCLVETNYCFHAPSRSFVTPRQGLQFRGYEFPCAIFQQLMENRSTIQSICTFQLNSLSSDIKLEIVNFQCLPSLKSSFEFHIYNVDKCILSPILAIDRQHDNKLLHALEKDIKNNQDNHITLKFQGISAFVMRIIMILGQQMPITLTLSNFKSDDGLQGYMPAGGGNLQPVHYSVGTVPMAFNPYLAIKTCTNRLLTVITFHITSPKISQAKWLLFVMLVYYPISCPKLCTHDSIEVFMSNNNNKIFRKTIDRFGSRIHHPLLVADSFVLHSVQMKIILTRAPQCSSSCEASFPQCPLAFSPHIEFHHLLPQCSCFEGSKNGSKRERAGMYCHVHFSRCYYIPIEDGYKFISWDEAMHKCTLKGGELARLDSLVQFTPDDFFEHLKLKFWYDQQMILKDTHLSALPIFVGLIWKVSKLLHSVILWHFSTSWQNCESLGVLPEVILWLEQSFSTLTYPAVVDTTHQGPPFVHKTYITHAPYSRT